MSLEQLNLEAEDIVINVQGDEPMILPWMIEKVIQTKRQFPNYVINAFSRINSFDELESKSTIKIVVNKNKDLLYASRSKIPSSKQEFNLDLANKQVCIYAFNQEQLKVFLKTARGPIEKSEDIEIIRFIENSLFPVKMVDLGKINLHAVDYPEDIEKVQKLLNKND